MWKVLLAWHVLLVSADETCQFVLHEDFLCGVRDEKLYMKCVLRDDAASSWTV